MFKQLQRFGTTKNIGKENADIEKQIIADKPFIVLLWNSRIRLYWNV